jgi:hypothetical protein
MPRQESRIKVLFTASAQGGSLRDNTILLTVLLQGRLKNLSFGWDNGDTASPLKIKMAIAYTDRQQALDFEPYLKTPPGRAFEEY